MKYMIYVYEIQINMSHYFLIYEEEYVKVKYLFRVVLLDTVIRCGCNNDKKNLFGDKIKISFVFRLL